MILSRTGRHAEALRIYAHHLKSPSAVRPPVLGRMESIHLESKLDTFCSSLYSFRAAGQGIERCVNTIGSPDSIMRRDGRAQRRDREPWERGVLVSAGEAVARRQRVRELRARRREPHHAAAHACE